MEGQNIYLIADDYIERSYIPRDNSNIKLTDCSKSNKGVIFGNGFDTNSQIPSSSKYTGSSFITEDNPMYKFLNEFYNKSFISTYDNFKAVDYMLDTSVWSGYKDKNGLAKAAVGAPTIELALESINDCCNKTYIAGVNNNKGYYIKISPESTYEVNSIDITKDNPGNLYFNDSTENANGYWIASPNSAGTNFVFRFSNMLEAESNPGLKINKNTITYPTEKTGFRPIVILDYTKCKLVKTNESDTVCQIEAR